MGFGKLGEFVEGKESFDSYVERADQFFEANEIDDGKRVAVFLSVIGASAYSILRNLVQPDLPKDKSFDELVDVLKNHFNPKPLVISERFKFHKRSQRENESVSDYVVEIKKLSVHCDFGTFLPQALRDRLVCGLKSEPIQRKLLAEADLTFDNAVKIAVTMETAEKDTYAFSGKERAETVHANYKSNCKKTVRAGNQPNKGKTDQSTLKKVECFRCGGDHYAVKCKYKNSKCFSCGKRGHIANRCNRKSTNCIEESDAEEEDDSLGLFTVYTSGGDGGRYTVPLLLDGNEVSMEIDTGSACTIINEDVYKHKLGKHTLDTPSVNLKSYSGQRVELVGECMIPVHYKNQRYILKVLVVKGKRPCLLGRDWLQRLKLDWKTIFMVSEEESFTLNHLLDKYIGLFSKSKEPIRGFRAQVNLRDKARPCFQKARPVPYALKEKVTSELKRLEDEGILEKSEFSDWATPIVVVPKPDKSIRICGDYKVTVNKNINEERYPLPNVDDMFAVLSGGKKFTKLDLAQAYSQLELDEESEHYLTINTHLGLYKYKRLAYGVSSSPAIFQSVMDKVLAGIPGVVCRIDDILITGESDEKHLCSLKQVLEKLELHNIKLRRDKCVFMAEKVLYMGHLVDSEGIHTTPEKVEAMLKAPQPTNVTELRSFLGLVNYYGSFLPQLSTVLNPLYDLLKKNQKWYWSKACEESFELCKKLLVSNQVLVHYDMKKPLRLACDASSYGLVAVISHVTPDGKDRPIAYASRTLSSAEKNYSQLEKEALSIIFGVTKFHKYLYGRKFEVLTDHEPLKTIFGPKRGLFEEGGKM